MCVWLTAWSRVLQRYQRLKTEVAELLSDVEQVKEGQKSSEKMLEVSPVDLAQDVRQREWVVLLVYDPRTTFQHSYMYVHSMGEPL